MKKFADECVSCPLPCIGCGLKHVEYHVCDSCGREIPLLYFEGGELCADCIKKMLVYSGLDVCGCCGCFEPLYEFEAHELCMDCIIHGLKKVN